jgi:ubiquitin-protein ligase
MKAGAVLFVNKQFSCCSDGGFFNAIMSFPKNYPNSPPTVRFTSEMWHPNGERSSVVFNPITIFIV